MFTDLKCEEAFLFQEPRVLWFLYAIEIFPGFYIVIAIARLRQTIFKIGLRQPGLEV